MPYDCFRTADAFLVGAVNDRQFRTLCRLLARDDLAADPRFAANDVRVRNRAELNRLLDDLFARRSTDDWLTVFEGSGMPYGPINSMERVFAHPQTAARDMVQAIDDSAVASRLKVLGVPVKFSHDRPSIRCRPPRLGEHTDSVLRELSIGDDEISQLRQEGVI